MDFGDILNRWEKHKPERAGKRIKSTERCAPAERVNPLDAWMRVNGIFDKDAEAGEQKCDAPERRRRLRHKKPDAVIDIHGYTRDEAWEAVARFFDNARGRGFEKVLVIHGKGNHSRGEAVLKRVVREFIEMCPYAGESGQDDVGGTGATWILLKRDTLFGSGG